MGTLTQIIVTAMLALLVGVPAYHLLQKCYDEEEFEARKTAMRDYAKQVKSILHKAGIPKDAENPGDDTKLMAKLSDKERLTKTQHRAGVLLQSTAGKTAEWRDIYQ
jgi:arabinogalactan endo-1,4-beta-galactosidase